MSTTQKSYRMSDESLAELACTRDLCAALAQATGLPATPMSDAAVLAYALTTTRTRLEEMASSIPAMRRALDESQ